MPGGGHTGCSTASARWGPIERRQGGGRSVHRPPHVGALKFGRDGDKYGRRGALVATVIIMGAASALTGLLPIYETAAVVAPVLLTLLRSVQGVATGGERAVPP
ncbi:MFS transporter [Arthrobacter sp. SO3]|uniref:MFS transporter n=1 Tax=Arthrobacter sp. SO3 TaxID=1897057 RepID=UPI001CFF9BFD|nr:MFS transporter [Arthrobacter sp. SO3]MCB5292985.1 Proline/betaine transporter [Arthrobacter sp. SO3]